MEDILLTLLIMVICLLAEGFFSGAEIGVVSADRILVVKGGRIVEGGERHSLGGLFYQPTVVGNVTADMAFAREEIFGPVAPIFKFRTEEEAIAMANDTEFGLAAYLYTGDQGRSWRVAEGIEYGMVGVNESLFTSQYIPFGGVKESGQGREGSRYGIDEYVETKFICLGNLDA